MFKKVSFVIAVVLFISCDPLSIMDAEVTNASSQNIVVSLVYASDSVQVFQIKTDSTVLIQKGYILGDVVLRPSFAQYDSIYISDEQNAILKVYKPIAQGKNIYDIEGFWEERERSKRYYQYDFLITNEDLE